MGLWILCVNFGRAPNSMLLGQLSQPIEVHSSWSKPASVAPVCASEYPRRGAKRHAKAFLDAWWGPLDLPYYATAAFIIADRMFFRAIDKTLCGRVMISYTNSSVPSGPTTCSIRQIATGTWRNCNQWWHVQPIEATRMDFRCGTYADMHFLAPRMGGA